MNRRKRTAQNDRISHPPTPSCQDRLFSEWGTLRIISTRERSLGQGASQSAGVGRVRNAIVFSCPLDEGRERRIGYRIADQPF
jgi:hypothetical protein